MPVAKPWYIYHDTAYVIAENYGGKKYKMLEEHE